jgi:hypothetical protein
MGMLLVDERSKKLWLTGMLLDNFAMKPNMTDTCCTKSVVRVFWRNVGEPLFRTFLAWSDFFLESQSHKGDAMECGNGSSLIHLFPTRISSS